MAFPPSGGAHMFSSKSPEPGPLEPRSPVLARGNGLRKAISPGTGGGRDGFRMIRAHNTCNAGDPGSVPESGKSSGAGTGYPLQYSCLENFMDREAWWATVHGVAKSRTRLSD